MLICGGQAAFRTEDILKAKFCPRYIGNSSVIERWLELGEQQKKLIPRPEPEYVPHLEIRMAWHDEWETDDYWRDEAETLWRKIQAAATHCVTTNVPAPISPVD